MPPPQCVTIKATKAILKNNFVTLHWPLALAYLKKKEKEVGEAEKSMGYWKTVLWGILSLCCELPFHEAEGKSAFSRPQVKSHSDSEVCGQLWESQLRIEGA